jgi:hypothetical protein
MLCRHMSMLLFADSVKRWQLLTSAGVGGRNVFGLMAVFGGYDYIKNENGGLGSSCMVQTVNIDVVLPHQHSKLSKTFCRVHGVHICGGASGC